MAQYNFKGSIDNITDLQLEFINKVIGGLGFENSEVLFENVGLPGDNYVATVKRLTVKGDSGSLSIIAKIAPSNELTRKMMNTCLFFRNEHIMYTKVLPKLVQLQKQEDISEEEQLKYAKCYGSFSESPNEVILLEDLKTSNYTMLDRFVSLSDECVRSVLKNFAILHSLSYVLKQKEPETFASYKESLKDMWSIIAGTEEINYFFQALENDTVNLLKDLKNVSLINNKIIDMLNQTVKLSKIDNDSKYSIIQQGDAWTNNIMFRFEDNKCAGSIMIDYQVSKVTNPVVDIMYMIFNCTDYETRRHNFHDWIDYYHTELDNSLSNFGLKANYIYPRDKLDVDLKRYGKLMFGSCVYLANMLLRKSDDAAKILAVMKNENSLDIAEQAQQFGVSQLDEETVNRFRDRVVGLINSFTEFGLL